MATRAQHAAMLEQAMRRYFNGDPQGAGALCEAILKDDRSHPKAMHLLGACRMTLGDPGAAADLFTRALSHTPGDPDLHLSLAGALVRLGRTGEADQNFTRTLELRPGDPGATAARADLLFRLRRFDEAWESIRPIVESERPSLQIALVFATLCPRIGRHEECVGALERALAQQRSSAQNRMTGLFALADTLDALGRTDEAFQRYTEAHAIKAPRPDVAQYAQSLDRMLAAWTPERIAALPSAEPTETLVFIVGMPRSGTSLVEQILASHPGVAGAGERHDLNALVAELQAGRPLAAYHLHHLDTLTHRGLVRAQKRILDRWRAATADKPGASRITDKNPANLLHLGLISRLFPGAKVIRCVRDPADTCFSCWTNNIVGLHAFADSLPALAGWSRVLDRVATQWKEVLDLPILDVVYEDLVRDDDSLRAGAKSMLEHIGMPWSDDVLRFDQNPRIVQTPSMDQVRRPRYATSIGRAKRYEKHLGLLIEGLKAAPTA